MGLGFSGLADYAEEPWKVEEEKNWKKTVER